VNKREAILQAALELFAERGFHGTAVPLIAEKARVGAGTIYRHFKDKEGLVNELYRRWKTHLFERVTKDLPPGLPARSLFHEVWVRWIGFGRDYPQSLLFLEAHHHSPYLDDTSRALIERIQAAFVEMMANACRDQIFKAVPPQLHMSFMAGVISQLVKDAWADGCDIELTPDIIAQAEEMCWQALRR